MCWLSVKKVVDMVVLWIIVVGGGRPVAEVGDITVAVVGVCSIGR